MSSTVRCPEWVPTLRQLVQRQLDVDKSLQPDRLRSLQSEQEELQGQIAGYLLSLGKRELATNVRTQLEAALDAAVEKQQSIESLLADMEAQQAQASNLVSDEEILDRLSRLHQVLADNNVTLGNLELSLHIDRIDCFPDGKVRLRTCKLGASPAACELLAGIASEAPQASAETPELKTVGKPRRRARRKFFGADRESLEDRDLADFAANPKRFDGLPDEFFWVDELQLPEKLCWSESHAEEVWVFWKSAPGRSKAAVARHFAKSLPTIRRAIRIAEEKGSATASNSTTHE